MKFGPNIGFKLGWLGAILVPICGSLGHLVSKFGVLRPSWRHLGGSSRFGTRLCQIGDTSKFLKASLSLVFEFLGCLVET